MINKDKLKYIRQNWFKVPNLLLELGLSSNAVAIYCYMCACSVKYNPSVREICKQYNLSRRTVYRAINELLKANVLVLVKPANRLKKQAAVYGLNSNKLWTKIATNSDIDQKLDTNFDSDS